MNLQFDFTNEGVATCGALSISCDSRNRVVPDLVFFSIMMNRQTWKPLTPETWNDFEALFGPRGACGGCWCMTWRLSRSEFKANGGEGNRSAMRALVDAGQQPGVLLYQGGRAVAWCAVAPREDYVRLGASKVWAPVDEQKVWSVSCFFIDKKARGQGISVEVLKAAVEFARSRGATIVEGYPQELQENLPASFVWTGVMPTFERAGFHEVARRSAKKPIMRTVVSLGAKK